MEREQTGLFGPPPPPVGSAPVRDEDRALAGALPPGVRFGTSSWTFPGWTGEVWDRAVSEATLSSHGLEAYARQPLLGAVGIDRTWYRPVQAEVFEAYAAVVPSEFRFLVKAHDHCTLPFFPDQARYGDRRGEDNPRFLDPTYAVEEVVGPALEGLGDKLGVLLFQMTPVHAEAVGGPGRFAERLHSFLDALPVGVPVAVELRSRSLFSPAFGDALSATGAVPCLNVWTDVPDLRSQARLGRAASGDQLVIRWLLRPGMRYLEARQAFAPFEGLKEADRTSRDVLARAIRAYSAAGKEVLCIVTNRAEGCAPASIRELARRIVELGEDPS